MAEVEPNNDFAQPQPIAMNVTVNGVADNEDVDYYAVKAKKGDRITAEVEGIRLGLTLFDPYVAILDAKRFELESSDDSALVWQDGFVSVVAPEDGTYIVVVRESAYAGNANCLYRLHVGDFPRPTATVPAGGKVGESVDGPLDRRRARRADDEPDPPGGGSTATSAWSPTTSAAPPPTRTPSASARSATPSRPSRTTTPATATPFDPPVALNGVIGAAGDVDFYTFKAEEGAGLRRPRLRPPDPLAARLGADDRREGRRAGSAGNDDSGGPDSYIRFNAPKDGEYVVSVADHLKKGGPDYAYRVEIGPVSPQLVLSTPNESLRRGTPTMAVAVPRGNRQAILINADRADFGGALDAGRLGPPRRGRRSRPTRWPPARNVVPVLFSAAADAPVAATLARVSGRPADPKLDIPGEFTSTAELVLGQNNVPVLDPHGRLAGRGRDRGGAVHDRGRRAEGADRPRRDDGPEGRRQEEARLHRADRRLAAVEPAGHRLEGGHRHPRGEGRGARSRQRQRRGPAELPGRSSSTGPTPSPRRPAAARVRPPAGAPGPAG